MTTRLVRFVALSAVLALGASPFISTVGACGGSQTNGSCREVTPAYTLLVELRALVATIDTLIP